jgi:thioredoxin reductase
MDGCDVVVVGGGAAGLNAALVLARSRRSVVVVDAGEPRNAPSGAVHAVLGQDGMPPADVLERGRAEVRRYGVRLVHGEATATDREGDGFVVTLAGGQEVRCRRLLVATGLADELPEVPGVRDRWGRDVLHCPYCHGWEVRDRAIGVLAAGTTSVHQALLFRQLSEDVVYFTHHTPPDEAQAALLAARRIEVVDGPVAGLEVDGEHLARVRLEDGRLVERDVVVVSPRMVARADFLAGLGLMLFDDPSGLGRHIPADAAGRTNVAGVYVAGNVTDLAAQFGAAAAAGAVAAAHLNADLVDDEAAQAASAVSAR